MTRGFPLAKDGPDPADIGSTPLDVRRALLAIIGDTPGVVTGGVVTGTAGWAYDVTGTAWRQRRGADAETDGLTATFADAVTVTTDPAPGAGSRWDIIYAHQRNTEHSDPDGEGIVDVQIGTVGGAAPVGDLPDGAVELARYQISAGMANTAAATRVTTYRATAAPLPVAQGGTGGATASAARTALGAAAAWPARADRAVTSRRTDSGSVSAGDFTSIHSLSLPAGAPAGLYLVDIDVLLTATTAGGVDVRATTSSPVVNLTSDDKMYVTADGGRGHWVHHLEHSGGARTITLYVQPAMSGVAAPAGSRITATWMGPLA